MRIIEVRQGNEFRTIASNIYDEKQFFYQSYLQAAQCIGEIVNESIRFRERTQSGRQCDFRPYPPMSQEQALMGYSNNIVAFCAKRGQGKTSAMLSMAKAIELLPLDNLSEKYRSDAQKFWDTAQKEQLSPGGVSSGNRVTQSRFFVLDPIDPTMMEPCDSMFQNICSRMFQSYETYWNRMYCDRKDIDIGRGETLLKAFQRTFSTFMSLKNRHSSDDEDDLTRMSEASDSARVKKAFSALVEKFLAFIGKDMLVIQIDDADLATERAYELVEEIRKYCVIPNVLVLMAVHLETLRNCIEQENVRQYKYLLSNSMRVDHMDPHRCREIAERYIDKLIPGNHQIHLPYVEDSIRERSIQLDLKYLDKDGNDKLDVFPAKAEDGQENSEEERPQYQDILMRLVYKKTGVILMPPRSHLHNFIPRRFRELTHFLSIFASMKSVIAFDDPHAFVSPLKLFELRSTKNKDELMRQKERELEEELRQRLENLNQLEVYFFQHWCPPVVSKTEMKALLEIWQAPLRSKNKRTMAWLNNLYPPAPGLGVEKEHSHPEDKSSAAQETGYAWAQISGRLDEILHEERKEQRFGFIYAIRLYYTIYMNKIVLRGIESGKGFKELYDLYNGHLSLSAFLGKDEEKASFSVSVHLLKVLTADIKGTNDQTVIDRVCVPLDNGVEVRNVNSVFRRDGSQWKLSNDYHCLRVNLFYAPLNELRRFESAEEWTEGDYTVAASALQLLCNSDCQYRVKKYIQPYLRALCDWEKGITFAHWAQKVFTGVDAILQKEEVEKSTADIFGEIEINKHHLPIVSGFGEMFPKGSGHNESKKSFSSMLTVLYLANPSNCVEEYKNLLQKIHEAVDAEQFRAVLAKNDAIIQELCKIPAFVGFLTSVQNEEFAKKTEQTENKDLVQKQLNEVEQKRNMVQGETDIEKWDDLVAMLLNENWLSGHDSPN